LIGLFNENSGQGIKLNFREDVWVGNQLSAILVTLSNLNNNIIRDLGE